MLVLKILVERTNTVPFPILVISVPLSIVSAQRTRLSYHVFMTTGVMGLLQITTFSLLSEKERTGKSTKLWTSGHRNLWL